MLMVLNIKVLSNKYKITLIFHNSFPFYYHLSFVICANSI